LCQAANPTIILVHGVSSSGDPKDFRYAYLPMRNWLVKNIPNAKVVDFDWAQGKPDSPAQASIQIGERRDPINGMSASAWRGSDLLKAVIAAQQSPVCIIAHSQGTAVTLAALKDSKKVSCVVLMGSPLYQGLVLKPLQEALSNTDVLINLASTDDTVVSLPESAKKAFAGVAIGRAGLPDVSGAGFSRMLSTFRHTRFLNLQTGPVIESIILTGVAHSGESGWWAAGWLDNEEAWPESFGVRDFTVAIRGSKKNFQ
jgi:pimeloyl-ACP methyl ester carboxylesterase